MTQDQIEERDEIQAASGYKQLGDVDAKESIEIYKEYKGARQVRYNDMVENDRFYHGEHYDEDEKTQITARGQAPLPINATYSLIKQMVSLITGADPIWYVDPVGDSDKSYAYLMRKLMDATWYLSRGSRQFSQIAKECAVTGAGFGMVAPVHDDFFWVKFSQIPYHQSFVSPSVREFNYEDTENWVISKTLSVSQIAKMFGKTKEWVEKVTEGTAPDAGDDEKAIRYARYVSASSDLKTRRLVQRYTQESATVYTVKPKGSDEVGQRVFFSLPDHIKQQAKRGEVEIVEMKNKQVIAKYITVGNYCEKYYLPITKYPIVPFIDEFNGNPYPLGEVDFLYGIQRAVDKFILLAILNATLSNNMKVMSPKGAIDKDEFEQNYAMPAALIEYEWREGMPAPSQINPMPLSSEFYAFPRILISLMEYITGIFGVIQGNPEGAPRTASGLMSLQNYGGQKVKLLARNMQDALSSLGDVGIQLYQNYSPYNASLTYYKEGDDDITSVNYNTLKSEGGKVKVENNISQGKFRTRVTVVQNYGSERDMKANLLANLAAQTRSPALLKPILKLADIPEADQIIREIDEVANARKSVEQMQQQLERLSQINKQLENQLIQAGIKINVANAGAQIEANLAKLKAETGLEMKGAVMDAKQRLEQAVMTAETQQQ